MTVHEMTIERMTGKVELWLRCQPRLPALIARDARDRH
jgi:hypothetical protein